VDDGKLRIAALAKRAAVSAPTLRYYEEVGLLRPAARSEAGYRLYGPEALGRIGFIQRAKALGLTLREIRLLVQEPTEPGADLARLRHALAHKLADTRRRIAELETLQAELEVLHARLGALRPPCGHLGDCGCWLPTREEVGCMATTETTDTDTCSCCDCACPSDDGDCSCCGCPQPCC
jgi:DNA-binding transcriptional MerR regulator